jgi:hypothetical protein
MYEEVRTGQAALSAAAGHSGVRRWRIHDELAGAGDGVRLKLDLVVPLLNGSSYGMIRWKMDSFPDLQPDPRCLQTL